MVKRSATITFRIDPDLRDKIVSLAQKDDRTISDWVHRALRMAVDGVPEVEGTPETEGEVS